MFGSSPRLFAAYRVLRRLLAPRHPPYALNNLIVDARARYGVSKVLVTILNTPTDLRPYQAFKLYNRCSTSEEVSQENNCCLRSNIPTRGKKNRRPSLRSAGRHQGKRVANLVGHPGVIETQVGVLLSTTAWAFYTSAPGPGQGPWGLASRGPGSNPTMGVPSWIWILVGAILLIVLIRMVA